MIDRHEVFWIENETGGVEPVDMLTWARYYETASRQVALDKLGERGDVSTVFLGSDHRFWGEGPPLIYETLVFGGPLDGEMERYCTREEAAEGHRRMVDRVKREAEALELEEAKR